MTIELSSHVLSFNKKLFLSVISLFIAFAICFMAFQYRREKEYKIELLNTQLQNYNDRLNKNRFAFLCFHTVHKWLLSEKLSPFLGFPHSAR